MCYKLSECTMHTASDYTQCTDGQWKVNIPRNANMWTNLYIATAHVKCERCNYAYVTINYTRMQNAEFNAKYKINKMWNVLSSNKQPTNN